MDTTGITEEAEVSKKDFSEQCANCSRFGVTCFDKNTQYMCEKVVPRKKLFKPEPVVLSEELYGAREEKIVKRIVEKYGLTETQAWKKLERSYVWKDAQVDDIRLSLDRVQIVNMDGAVETLDDIDVVPASYYPDMITEAPDLMDRLISTQAWYEDNVITESYNFDDQYVKEGVSSIKFDFNGTPNPNGTQGMCINSPTLVEQWDDQSWDDAVVKFWIYNASDTDIKMQLRVLDTVRNFNLDWGGEYYVERVAAPNQWTLVLFSLRRLGINRPLVKNAIHADELTVKFYSPKSSYTFYIDGVNIVDHSEYPEVDNTMVVPSRIETLTDGWENMERDYGWEKGTISTEMNEVCTSTNPSSVTSRKIQFITSDIANHSNNPDYVINPQQEYGDNHLPSFVGKTLEFDVKFSANITNYEIGLKIVAPNGQEWADKIYTVTPVDGEDGWKHASFDFTSYSEDAEILSSVIRVGFIFNGVDDTNKSTALAYLDNIFLKSSN